MINLLKSPQNKGKKIVALIDGEHYPQINLDAVLLLKKHFKGIFAGIIFLGGTEKLTIDNLQNFYGCIVKKIENLDNDFIPALNFFKPDIVYDLSDEPVVNYCIRMKIASFCFTNHCSYMGPDFYFEYETKKPTVLKPSLLIIGTGKRIGKTAVSLYISKLISEKKKICIVSMGRGGPKKPQLMQASKINITPEFLLNISRKGFHASSDYIEDALFAGVDTIGCRRCGGGFGGKFFLTNIEKGLKIAESLKPQVLVIEGSGASIPAVETDFKVCVVGANQDWNNLVGYLGIYRMIISDIIFMTLCEEPISTKENIKLIEQKIFEIKKDAKIVKSVFRPVPLYDIKDKKVFLTLTASSLAEKTLKDYLESKYNCKVVKISFNLSNRKRLREDLYSINPDEYDMLITELKAASVDVVTEYAVKHKKQINYINNIPVIIDGKQHLDSFINKILNF